MASSSSTETIPSPPEFTFTPSDTRLKITYKNAPAYAHVSSQAMALASPVWKSFLFPTWRTEGSTVIQEEEDDIASGLTKLRLDPVQELDFTEDNAEALLVLLCLAHLELEDILNETPSKQLLIDLAIICDKYLCKDLIKPWVGHWIDRQWDKHNSPEDGSDRETQAMLLVGSVFAPRDIDRDFFEKALNLRFFRSRDDTEVPENWPLPASMNYTIAQARALRRGLRT